MRTFTRSSSGAKTLSSERIRACSVPRCEPAQWTRKLYLRRRIVGRAERVANLSGRELRELLTIQSLCKAGGVYADLYEIQFRREDTLVGAD